MNNTIEYNGYVGSVEFSEEDCIFYGKVMGIRALLSYEGSTAAELVSDIHGAADDYLALCEAEGREPERTNLQNQALELFEKGALFYDWNLSGPCRNPSIKYMTLQSRYAPSISQIKR